MPRGRRSDRETFLTKLQELAKGETTPVGNISLQKELNWSTEKYKRISEQLKTESLIRPGRGQGGSVALVKASTTSPLNLFVVYAHSDEALKDELLKHLAPLKRLELINAWHDRKIVPGEEWDEKISTHLEKSQIILLLVSIDLMNSSYCYDIEVERALELHDQEKAKVVPIILRSCMWNFSPFAKIQASPKDAKPVTAWPDKDEAFTSIAEGIRQLAEQIMIP